MVVLPVLATGPSSSRDSISSGCQPSHNYLHRSVAVLGIAVAVAVIPLLPAGAETLSAE